MRKKILLVDDSDTILLLEKMILSERYDIVTARNGQLAIEVARKEKPDVILLDVNMPVLDGFETLRLLRSDEHTQETPILMVTTLGEEENMIKGYSTGCSDYVTKPIHASELLAKVENCIARPT